MLAIAKAFLEHPELQAAVVAVLTTGLLRLLKKWGVLIFEGEDRLNRLKAAVTAVVLGLGTSYVAHVTSGAAIDWANLAVAVVLAWVSATGLHTLTRPKKPRGLP